MKSGNESSSAGIKVGRGFPPIDEKRQVKIAHTRGCPFFLPRHGLRCSAVSCLSCTQTHVCNMLYFLYMYSLIICLSYASYFFSFHTAGWYFSYSLSSRLPKFYVFAQVYVYIIFILCFCFSFFLFFSFLFSVYLYVHTLHLYAAIGICNVQLYIYIFLFLHIFMWTFLFLFFFLLFFVYSFTYLFIFLYA